MIGVRSVVCAVAVALSLGACSYVKQQVGMTSVNGCIQNQCRDPNAADYTRCEAACRATYGK
jgi:hypothetical protein